MLNRLQATAIKLKRIKKGLTVIELAKKVGITRTSLYNYEKGKQFPSPTIIAKIAQVLDCDIKELID
jgi:transcriptional regulator with XRE-family HTH domain